MHQMHTGRRQLEPRQYGEPSWRSRASNETRAKPENKPSEVITTLATPSCARSPARVERAASRRLAADAPQRARRRARRAAP
eukprot:1266857-Pleurochrysis_carterae.AAC.2